jgi:glucan 1,3-beta-glucosidase
MHRRDFLKTTVGGAVALAAAGLPRIDFAQATGSAAGANTNGAAKIPSNKIRGVNLGGWLVLEKWMVPDVYRKTDAEDEYNLCLTLGDEAKGRLNRHRETFITAEDFRWIADHGLNAVRLPVGYWALEAPKPYVESSQFIDFALAQAHKNNLKLLLDLHGAPGSQNG